MARPVWSFEAQADDAEEQYRRLRQNVKTCEEEKNAFFFGEVKISEALRNIGTLFENRKG